MRAKFTYHNSREDALRADNPVEHGRFRRVEKAGRFIVEEQLELTDKHDDIHILGASGDIRR